MKRRPFQYLDLTPDSERQKGTQQIPFHCNDKPFFNPFQSVFQAIFQANFFSLFNRVPGTAFAPTPAPWSIVQLLSSSQTCGWESKHTAVEADAG